MGHYARVIRGGKVLDTDTDKILLEDGGAILYEENGIVENVEVIDKNNNVLRAHYPNDFFVGDNLMLNDSDKILLEDDSGDFLLQEDFTYWIKTSYNTRLGTHYLNSGEGEFTTPSGLNYKSRRKNYARIWGIYSSDKDMFHSERPRSIRKIDNGREFESWTMDNLGQWKSPHNDPPEIEDRLLNPSNEDVPIYHWFEDFYQTDNTKGWILIKLSNL